MPPIDRKWYDSGNIDEMHEDLRTDYKTVSEVLMKRPSTGQHFEICSICQQIKAENEKPAWDGSGMAPPELMRRRKTFILDAGQIGQILDLPPHAAIAYMTVIGYQDILSVIVCSPEYEVVPVGTGPLSVRVSLEDD